MKLRKLMPKDAERMLEWMKDPSINRFFRFDAEKMTIENVLEFIQSSQNTGRDMHLAIVDDNDTYVGTISLKNIDYDASNAEYAISMCASAHGTGAAFEATKEILRIAFEELKLHRVYLNVLEDNQRANRFYQKFGFAYEGQFREHLKLHGGELKNLNWYSMLKNEYEKLK
jgi:RimJ/RimL family protein N-acetyltransferase